MYLMLSDTSIMAPASAGVMITPADIRHAVCVADVIYHLSVIYEPAVLMRSVIAG